MEMENPKELKILWHSVAPYVRSGYGTVTKNICFRLKAFQYPVVISTYYGLMEGGMLNLGGCPVLPIAQGDGMGKFSVPYYVSKFNIDLPILHTDFWAFDWFAKMPHSILYGPTDHAGYDEKIIDVMRDFEEFIVASKWSLKECRKYRADTMYIPHGVNTSIYKPQSRDDARRLYDFPLDKFIIGIVAANNDSEPRKGWDQMFLGIKKFMDTFPSEKKNMYVFAYTHPNDPRGFALSGLVRSLGLRKYVYFPEAMPQLVGLSDEEMAMLYSSFDIEMNCSRREGFCIPALEAQSCGIPVIATNFSSFPELIKGHGWLVKPGDYVYSPLNGRCVIPDENDIAKALEDAYFNREKRLKFGTESRNFALQYDWDKIIKEYWLPFLKRKEEELYSNKEAKTIDIPIDIKA